MTRTIFLSAAILAGLPMFAFGQTRTAVVQVAEPCCGQAVSEDESIEQILLETQRNLQKILMPGTTAKRLQTGDYLISESLDGYEFRALVFPVGIVDGWYIADWYGTPIALINANGSLTGTAGSIDYCTAKFSRDISGCAYLKSWPNRQQLCLNAAWDSFFNCLASRSSVLMR